MAKRWHLIIFLVVIFALVEVAVILHWFHVQEQLIHSTTQQSAKLYISALSSFREMYSNEVVAKAENFGMEIHHNPSGDNEIPLPATLSMALGKKIGMETNGAVSKLYSPYPFPWRKERPLSRDLFAQDAWNYLNQNPESSFSRIEDTNNGRIFRFSIADVMYQSCVDCHNNHIQSPKTDWNVGDVRGVLEVQIPMKHTEFQIEKELNNSLVLLVLFAMSGFVLICWIVFKLKDLDEVTQQRVTVEPAQELQKESIVKTEGINKALLEFSLEAIVIFDEDQKIIDWNPHAMSLFGWSREQMLGEKIDKLLVLPKTFRKDRQHPTITDLPLNQRCEILGIHSQTNQVPIEIFIVPISVMRQRCFLAFIRDLVKEKEEEKRLIEMREAMEKKYREKREFLSSMSQEVRTPMNGILGMLQLLGLSDLNHEQKQQVNFARLNGEYLVNFVDDFIAILDNDSGELKTIKSHLDFRKFLEGFSRKKSIKAFDDGLDFALFIENTIPEDMIIDSRVLEKLLSHLLDEVIHYSEEGCIRVHASVKVTPQSSNLLVVQINANKLKEIPENSVGFVMSHRLVEHLAGELSLQQSEDSGFDISFEIPFLMVTEDVSRAWLCEQSILSYHPQPIANEEVAYIFKDTNVAVVSVTSKEDVLDHLAGEQTFSLVILCAEASREFLKNPLVSKQNILLTLKCPEQEIDRNYFSMLRPLSRNDLWGFKHWQKKSVEKLIPKKVLVVEDNKVNQQVVSMMLRSCQFDCDIATNGNEALEALDKEHYSLILMDLQMPKMDGYETTQKIREREKGTDKHIPIIALTSNTSRNVKEECLNAGMNNYLSKPLKREELRSILSIYFSEESEFDA